MIEIGNPYIYEKDDFAFLQAHVTITDDVVKTYSSLQNTYIKTHWRLYENYPPVEWDNSQKGLYFAVPLKFKDGLCADKADAFVVAMLWYAMTTGSDIKCEAPVSEQLYTMINNVLFPALCKTSNGSSPIKLISKTTNVVYSDAIAVGTGMSCGVDSLYTLQNWSNPNLPKKYRLTHLTYLNMGAIFHPNTSTNEIYSINDFYSITDEMSLNKLGNAQAVADMAGLELVYVKSNIDRDYYRGAYGYTGVYRNCACILALQKMFSTYYCSSAGWPDFFELNLAEGSEHYESCLEDCISTEGLRFVNSDYATRWEKTIAIADNPIAHRYLDVCFNFKSCGNCNKCYRTLITLDIIGKLDLFSQVFDIKTYRKNRVNAYAWLFEMQDSPVTDDNAIFARDIYKHAKDLRAIPKEAYLLYRSHNLMKKVHSSFYFRIFRKLNRKIKRLK